MNSIIAKNCSYIYMYNETCAIFKIANERKVTKLNQIK